MIPTHELVRRIAVVLHEEVGPATSGAHSRTQAFRAAGVLRRLARQLELAEAHGAAEAEDRRQLADDVHGLLDGAEAPATSAAAAALGHADDHKAALAQLVAALHDDRGRLPEATFERALTRVRRVLRADLDRELDVAR